MGQLFYYTRFFVYVLAEGEFMSFGSTSFVAAPFADDDASRTEPFGGGAPIIYFNKTFLTFPLNINKLQTYSLNINALIEHSLRR